MNPSYVLFATENIAFCGLRKKLNPFVVFSQGQIIFAILFIVVFACVIGFAYRRDRRLHMRNYKGVKWVALAFLLFIIGLFFLKYLLK